MNNFKKISYIIVLIIGSIGSMNGQTVSPYLIGNNYWYPASPAATLMGINGRMQQAGFKFIRIGGFGANDYSNAQRIEYIDRIRAMGAEPQLQVPYNYTGAQASALITYVNVTMKKNIKYWSIGNEPDHAGGGHQSITTVMNYTKTISSALKAVDPSIKVIAFELAGYAQNYDTDYALQKEYYLADGVTKNPNYKGYGNHFWNGLLGGAYDCTGKDANGNYYIDIISWHFYGWNDNVTSVTSKMEDMNNRLLAINAKRPTAPVQWMMGEINTHWDNYDATATANGLVWSFRAGQSTAEVYGAAMKRNALTIAFWSIYEGKNNGGCVDRCSGDLSLFDADYTPRPNYWHSWMLGTNMRSNVANSTDNNTNVETVAMKDANGVSVMILNHSSTTEYPYSVKLDAGTFTSPTTLQIGVDAAINVQYNHTLVANSTQMLVFNASGQLTKRITYSKSDADIKKDPTIETFSATTISPIPGKVEGESFDSQFGLQTAALDLSEGTDMYLGYTSPGDSAVYAINVNKSGDYKTTFRMTSNETDGGAFALYLDGSLLVSNIQVANTSGWQNWTTIATNNINLTAGQHKLTLKVTNGGFNLNWMNFEFVPEAPVLAFSNLVAYQNIPYGTDLNINVTAQHSLGMANVQLYLNNTLVRQENLAPFDWGLGANDAQLNTLHIGMHVFKAIATATNGDTASISITIFIKETITALVDEKNIERLTVYPNPANSLLNFSEEIEWEILNSLGRSMARGRGKSFDVERFAVGAYFLVTEGRSIPFIVQ